MTSAPKSARIIPDGEKEKKKKKKKKKRVMSYEL